MASFSRLRRVPPSSRDETLAAHALPTDPVDPEANCGTVFARFSAEPDLIAVPIVERGHPLGLMNRADMMTLWSSQYGRALFENRPIRRIMDAHPLVVDAEMNVDELQSFIAEEKPAALMRGFILTHRGAYFGMGSALALLKLGVERASRRSVELQRARDAAERASRSKSQFLATVSHELRTPLNAIIGFSDLMKSEILGPIAPARYAEYTSDIHTSGVLLLSLINDILDMAKIEAGRLELHEETIDVSDAVASALRLVRERALRARLALVSDIEAGLPGLRADLRAVRQMLLNLLSNAVKFTPEGGQVVVRASRSADGGVALAVSDTGIGIAPEHMQIVMEPFGQVTNAFTRQHDGTGLGLPLVKSLAELHDACFRIASRLGRGTDVTIDFPPSRTVPRDLRATA